MKFSSFTFVVTEECNFSCSYCYQTKKNRFLDKSTIKSALEFFFHFFEDECYIHFYGGEPLLAFDLIKYAIDCIQQLNFQEKKAIRYTISTNGSLLNNEIFRFLCQHKFSVLLSFDGLAQDMARQKGSFRKIVANIRKLLENPDVDLETNSVFTQNSVACLTSSIQFISELGVQKFEFALSQVLPWRRSHLIRLEKELINLRRMMLANYEKTGSILLNNYKKKKSKGIFACNAARNRMDLTPEGKLWGCNMFADYFRGKEKSAEYAKYCFGDLDSFQKNHDTVYPGILKNYSNLRMDRFYTSDNLCIDCDDLFSCGACPVDNLFSNSDVRKIARWECELKKIIRRDATRFWEELESRV